MKQQSLFSGVNQFGEVIIPPSVRGSATSEQAAVEIAPHVGTLQQRVLDYIRSCGIDGCTDEEAIDALKMNASTLRPRRIELVAAKLVIDSGETRATKSGRKAVVWRANQAG